MIIPTWDTDNFHTGGGDPPKKQAIVEAAYECIPRGNLVTGRQARFSKQRIHGNRFTVKPPGILHSLGGTEKTLISLGPPIAPDDMTAPHT